MQTRKHTPHIHRQAQCGDYDRDEGQRRAGTGKARVLSANLKRKAGFQTLDKLQYQVGNERKKRPNCATCTIRQRSQRPRSFARAHRCTPPRTHGAGLEVLVSCILIGAWGLIGDREREREEEEREGGRKGGRQEERERKEEHRDGRVDGRTEGQVKKKERMGQMKGQGNVLSTHARNLELCLRPGSKGKTRADAMKRYIDVVDEAAPNWRVASMLGKGSKHLDNNTKIMVVLEITISKKAGQPIVDSMHVLQATNGSFNVVTLVKEVKEAKTVSFGQSKK